MYKRLRKHLLRYKGYVRGRINRSRIVWRRRLEHRGLIAARAEKNRAGKTHTRNTLMLRKAFFRYEYTSSGLKSAQAPLEDAGYPLVSCLMPTCDRFSLAQRAVACFQKQTYPNKELVIVDDGADGDLGEWVGSLHDSRIRYTRSRDKERKFLGELRNIALENAQGEYIALWDDDDLSNPQRLMLQMQMTFAVRADGCFLTEQFLHWPVRRQLVEITAGSYSIFWQNTMVFKKSIIEAEKFPNVKRHVDGILVREIMPKTNIVLCHIPRLYLRTVHGANLWDDAHFEKMMRRCGAAWQTDSEYDRAVGEVSRELGFELDEAAPNG